MEQIANRSVHQRNTCSPHFPPISPVLPQVQITSPPPSSYETTTPGQAHRIAELTRRACRQPPTRRHPSTGSRGGGRPRAPGTLSGWLGCPNQTSCHRKIQRERRHQGAWPGTRYHSNDSNPAPPLPPCSFLPLSPTTLKVPPPLMCHRPNQDRVVSVLGVQPDQELEKGGKQDVVSLAVARNLKG